jgi:hypothetical protein
MEIGQRGGEVRAPQPWLLVPKDSLYKVAYDEAVRALSEQQKLIESFHARAGLLFSAAAVTTSFLGAQPLRGVKPPLLVWLACLCFLGASAACIAILWPRKWQGTANPREVIETYIESQQPAPLENLHRDLSLHMHSSYLKNFEATEQFTSLLQVASGLLALEVVLWVAAIVPTV